MLRVKDTNKLFITSMSITNHYRGEEKESSKKMQLSHHLQKLYNSISTSKSCPFHAHCISYRNSICSDGTEKNIAKLSKKIT